MVRAQNDPKPIFLDALQCASDEELAGFLDDACGGDGGLRQRVEQLLAAHQGAGDFLACPDPETESAQSGATPPEGSEWPSDFAGAFGGSLQLPLSFLTPVDRPGVLGRLDQFEVMEVLGQGGMGIVLRAHDTKLSRSVAIKVLSLAFAGNASARHRFIREAQAAAAVRHDHVVAIYEIGEIQGTPYLVMEHIEGGSLQQWINQHAPLAVHEVLRIGLQTALGLAAAHAEGLVHRDVKPANILLEGPTKRVKITDFGLARAADDASLTQSGAVTGTPQFMAPEQARGEAVDHRTDLFSLGSVLYAMCTGHSPFRATSTMATLRSVSDDTPRPIKQLNADIPDWLVAVIDKLLAKNPDERFQSAAEVAQLLSQCLAHVQQPSVAPLPEIPGTTACGTIKPPRLRRYLAAAAVLLVVAGGFGFSEATGVTQFVPLMIRVVTGEGTLVIQVDDPDISVLIDGEEISIKGAGTHEVRLRPGQYKLLAAKDDQLIRVELVTVTRGDKQLVNVHLEPSGMSKAASEAFVLLGSKDIAERKFDTLAEALLRATDGDTIEIRGNGPFIVEPIQITRSALTIRAGEGFRPVLRLDPRMEASLLRSNNSTLVLEGIEFQSQTAESSVAKQSNTIVAITGGVLRVANCRFTFARTGGGPSQCLHCYMTTQAEVRNSQFIRLGVGGGQGFTYECPPTGTLLMENCIDTGWYGFLMPALDVTKVRNVSIRLRRNTSAAQVGIFVWARGVAESRHSSDAGGAALLSLETTHNIFDSDTHVFRFDQKQSAGAVLPANTLSEIVRQYLAWREDRNLYASTVLLGVGHEQSGKTGGVTNVTSQVDWERFWNLGPSGSLRGAPKFYGGDVYGIARKGDYVLKPEDFRLRPDSPGYRAGSDGKDLGADIDLVGPGEAYERWKKTPEYQQWLKDTGQVK